MMGSWLPDWAFLDDRQNGFRILARRTVSQRSPHHALVYRTPAEVFHGGELGKRSYYGWRCAPGEESELLAGASGPSLNSTLILSK